MGVAILLLLLILLFCGVGILGLIISIYFFDYLKKYHSESYKGMCFESLFGVPRDDFFFHPVKPQKFIPFIFSAEDLDDGEIVAYKKKLKMVMIAVLVFFVIFFLFSIF
jgi:hypothetical protein